MISINEERCVSCGEIIPEGMMVCYKCSNPEPNFDKKDIKIKLDSIVDIIDFVRLTSKCRCCVLAKSERIIVSAKSIVGLYGLDLSKPIKVEFYGNIPHEVKEGMKKFIVD